MTATTLLVAAQLLILSVLGFGTLSLVGGDVRKTLLPAAPIFGAVLIAIVTNWTSRWMSVQAGLIVVGAVVTLIFIYGARRGYKPWKRPPQILLVSVLCILACSGGVAVTSIPAAIVEDTNAVAPTFVVDQFYFGAVSTYLVDEPVLPGPSLQGSWVEDDPPWTAPAAHTVRNSLRFGQSAVAAALSVMIGQDPIYLVSSVSLAYLLMLGLASFVFCRLLGLRTRWALLAPALVTSSFYVVSQPLEGKNDGLLGASFFLIAVGVSASVLRDARFSLPLVLVGAGLAATYSEYFLFLIPIVALLALVGARIGRIHRLNLLAGRWAVAALLVPWAWVWLAASFKTTTRYTDGPTPFRDRTDWTLVRTYLGVPTFGGQDSLNLFLTIAAVAVAVIFCVGWATFVLRHSARGALVGLLLVSLVLEISAAITGSGNIQYRVMQLAAPMLLCSALIGWVLLIEHVSWSKRGMRALRAGGALGAVLLMSTNLTAVVATTSYERARNQHVPAAFSAKLLNLVEEVGGSNVAVVAPNLTDTAALSMLLSRQPDVAFVVMPSSGYVGTVPRWDRTADDYYVLGPGATVSGDVTVVVSVSGYKIVRLGAGGMIFSPFRSTFWPRVSWMRGFPCALPGVELLLIRGGTGPASFEMSSQVGPAVTEPLRLASEDSRPIRNIGAGEQQGSWLTQTLRAPRSSNAIISIQFSQQLVDGGVRSMPVQFGTGDGSPSTPAVLSPADPALTDACFALKEDGTDGYDRELTLMQTPQ